MIALLLVVQFTSCKKDPDPPAVIASFTFAVDATDFMKVQFTNASQEYTTLAWEFGDGGTSTEVSPSHTYAAVGTYTVKLTATNGAVTDVHSETVTIADPNVLLTMLVGETSKTWKLIHDVTTKRYPLEVGPAAHDMIWWAAGKDNTEIQGRPCMWNDEWEFTRTGDMNFDDKDNYWAEGSVYPDGANNTCASSLEPMINKDGVDVSAWSSGNHTFELTPGTDATLKVIGLGAYLGLSKVATDAEVMVPQESVTYKIIKLYDGDVDTLVVETAYMTGGADPQAAYWRFVLVHYDDPNAEPPIPGDPAVANFTFNMDGSTGTATFINNSTLADSYLWEFGDGETSTEATPSHLYSVEGIYNVKLTAINGYGQTTASKTLGSGILTEADLTGGVWKLQLSERSIYVGPGMGSDAWWTVPMANLVGGVDLPPADDWSCMMDDEFIFNFDGVYEYKTNGGSRNDGYMTTNPDTQTNGCWSDEQIAGSGNGAAFGSCATHSYIFTPATATSKAIINLTNGSGFAAFIGFYKGYYGGENTDATLPANGGISTNQYDVVGFANVGDKKVMVVSVDLSTEHNGSKAWTMTLER